MRQQLKEDLLHCFDQCKARMWQCVVADRNILKGNLIEMYIFLNKQSLW